MPSIVPRSHAFDVDVYVVLQDFGHIGRAYSETDEERSDKQTLIDNIISGEFDRIIRVVAFNTAEGWSRDVTEDIARDVAEEAYQRHEKLIDAAAEFVDRFSLTMDA